MNRDRVQSQLQKQKIALKQLDYCTRNMMELCNGFTYKLIVNIDGLPLFSSTPNYKLYPILFFLDKVKTRPLCAGMYCTGLSVNGEMPSTHIYLKTFLQNIEYLIKNSLVCQGNHYHMQGYPIFVCDAPARSSLKAINAHTGYSSCERCVVHGEYHLNRVCLFVELQ